MKALVSCVVLTGMMFTAMVSVNAADEAIKTKKEKKAQGPQAGGQIFKLPEEVKLTEEQQEKLNGLKKEYGPKLAEAQKKIDDILTTDQKSARKDALAKAKAENAKGKARQTLINDALKLTDEQQPKWDAAQKEAQELQATVRGKISELLTDEQKALVPSLAPKKGKKKKTV